MKIGISGYYLLNKTSGYGRLIDHLLPALVKIDKENHYVIFVPEEIEGQQPANFETELVPLGTNILGDSFARFWWDHFQVPKVAFKAGVDLLHYPYPTLPLPRQRFPLVGNINNVIHWKFKEYRQGTLVKIRQAFKAKSFQQAAKIMVPSIATKMDIINLFHIPNEKIALIPYGKDPLFKKGISASEAENIKKRYNLKLPFILYVGSFDFRKNLKRLIRAFAIVSQKRPELNLLIAGGISTVVSPFVYSFSEMASYAQKMKVAGKVHFTHLIPTADLRVLYNLASAFVYPSLYEGFATAVIEAMACGCPTVVSNTSCLPEIVADAGILVDPYNENEMAAAIDRIVSDHNLRKTLIEKGLSRANDFSWEKTAMSTLKVYQEVVQ